MSSLSSRAWLTNFVVQSQAVMSEQEMVDRLRSKHYWKPALEHDSSEQDDDTFPPLNSMEKAMVAKAREEEREKRAERTRLRTEAKGIIGQLNEDELSSVINYLQGMVGTTIYAGMPEKAEDNRKKLGIEHLEYWAK